MNNFRFPQFDGDVTIAGIRHFFRYNDSSQWHVDIDTDPPQQKSHLTTSNASILARKRVLNPTRSYKEAGYPIAFTWPEPHKWRVKRIGDCPIPGYTHRPDASQFCFALIHGNLLVYLPQFELARTLFFHDSYLCNTAMESDCLDTEFYIERDSNGARILIMPSSGFSLTHFADPVYRKNLSWILLDAEAHKSYKSICTKQRQHGESRTNYRIWNFQFDPPPMQGTRLEVRGHLDRDEGCLFVYEIKAIGNLRADVPADIQMIHPDHTVTKIGEGHGTYSKTMETSETYAIHDGAAARMSLHQTLIAAPTVTIEFNKAFKVDAVPARQKTCISCDPRQEENTETISVSMEEATAGQGLRAANWNDLEDATDDTYLFANKFKCFFSMVDVLANTYDCTITTSGIRKLPKVPRCKKHLLKTDGNPRCMAVVQLETKGNTRYLLEVDTSDAGKALSTQILSVRNPSSWEADLDNLERELIRSSLRWPKDILAEICGNGRFKGITHPHSPIRNRSVLNPESIDGWAARVYRGMMRL
ncbi:Tn7-like element transposition protein TnsE [Pseudodesulfovibrio senegalensis]|uniref:Transposase n=1 Tax=Pseudodesulfovibrio senegalensis TaxID=1721087 RepID=A0A6N6N573_9BACT|nr:Tn7-like element transposition protein TnsE [Pseudodesulfovibrio senegalensis]KAB1442881.1 transposase [Pseudodesulfovibrio senegalensis]